jgi:hypothetical protein
VGADDKTAVNSLSVGVGRLGFRSGLLFFTRKRYKKKEISTSNILPECYSL